MKILFERATALYLYRCLGSENRLSRRTAMSNMDRMEEEVWSFLGEQVSADIEQYRTSNRQRTVLLFVTITSVLWSLYAQWFGLVPSHPDMLWIFLGLDLLALLSTVALTAHCATRHIVRRRIRNGLFLAQPFYPLEKLGALVDALSLGDDEISSLAQSLLIRLLPKTDANILTQAHLRALSQVLHGTNGHLIIAVLHAFERIGSPTLLPAVERLRHCPVWLVDAPQIERAAATCFEALKERSHHQAASRILLRPSATFGAPYPADKQLLVPAHATPDQLPKDLLRNVATHSSFNTKTTVEESVDQNLVVRG